MWASTSKQIFFILWLVTWAAPLYAGRPLVIDDAAVVNTGHIEFEVGWNLTRPHGGGRRASAPQLGFAYGVINRLELGLALQRVNHDDRTSTPLTGWEDLHLMGKYKFLDEAPMVPALAAAFDLKLPTANRSKGLTTGKPDETLLLIATKSLPSFALHANFGYTVVGRIAETQLRNRWRGGVAAEWPISQAVSLVGEVFGASRAESGGKNEADFQLGTRYQVHPTLVLDLAAGRSLRTAGTSIQSTFGLTWTLNTGKLLGE